MCKKYSVDLAKKVYNDLYFHKFEINSVRIDIISHSTDNP